MLTAFLKFIKAQNLFRPEDTILLAVSGGLDSMVMADLFHHSDYKFGIAHCNFQLRGKASDGDEKLVKNLAKEWDIPFHTIRFDTEKESEEQQKSIELMARELRYAWFEELLQIFDYQYVATAHHLNDSLETLLFNLTKGTGIRGLHGIPIKNGTIVRPLSFAGRKDLENYASEQQIDFREDASNLSLKHHRNLIRHQVIPPLKQINPSLEKTFSKTLQHLKSTESLFNWAVNFHKKSLLKTEGDLLKIPISDLKNAPGNTSILYEIINEYEFNSDHVDQIFRALDHVGAQFYSKTHIILVERRDIIIKRKKILSQVWLSIDMLPEQIALPKGILAAKILKEKPTQFNQGKTVALIDLNKIKLPLTIRNWKEGDRFQPIGMKGQSKKIKDFLRDEKVSRFDKATVLVIESEGVIVWVLGYRIDERFKVSEATEKILCLRIEV